MNTRTVFVSTAMLVCSTFASAQIAFISTYAGHDGGTFPGNGGPATSATITNPAEAWPWTGAGGSTFTSPLPAILSSGK